MGPLDQYLPIQELEQTANESGSEIGDSDLYDESVQEIDDDDSDVDVSAVVQNVQVPCVCFINSILLSGL